MRIGFLTFGQVPMPPVKGGAIEDLLQAQIEKNEITGEHEFVVFSRFDKNALIESAKYSHTKYIYIKQTGFCFIERVIRFIINRNLPIYIGSLFLSRALKHIKKIGYFDKIVIETAAEYSLKIPRKYVGEIILHLHNDTVFKSRKYEDMITKKIDRIFAVSKYIANRAAEIFPREKISVIYNGVDLNKFKIQRVQSEELKKKFNIKDKTIVFAFTGRLTADKGADMLLDAFLKMKTKSDTCLLFIGGKHYSNNNEDSFIRELKKKALKSQRKIFFTGYIPHEEIYKYYSISNVLAVPSMSTEALSVSAIEGLAASCPILVSDSGGIKELVNEKCGFVIKRDKKFAINLSEKMDLLADNRPLLQEMSKAARKRASNFTIETYTKRFLNLITAKGQKSPKSK